MSRKLHMIIGPRIQGKCRTTLLNPHHVQLSTHRVVVQERGLEPLASRSQAARSTSWATPGCGGGYRVRTCDPQINSLLLYLLS